LLLSSLLLTVGRAQAQTIAGQSLSASTNVAQARVLDTVAATLTVMPSRVIPPPRGARVGWNALYAAALADDGSVAAVLLSPPGVSVTLYASDGKPRWTRRLASVTINAIAVIGDTVVVVEQGETPSLIMLSKVNGAERVRHPMPLAEDEVPSILGQTDGHLYVQRQRNAGLYVARDQYRSLDRLDLKSGRWDQLLVIVDSSPRVFLDNGRDAVPPPFPPAPQFELSPQHGLLFHSGSELVIEQVSGDGARSPWIGFRPLSGPLTDSVWASIVAEWRAKPPVRLGVPDSTLTQAAAVGRDGRGRALGALFSASDGTLLVRRRDADRSASSVPIATTWDQVRPTEPSLSRFVLPPGTGVVDYARGGQLLLRQVMPDGKVTVSIATLSSEPGSKTP
jgi:hypothetical protein